MIYIYINVLQCYNICIIILQFLLSTCFIKVSYFIHFIITRHVTSSMNKICIHFALKKLCHLKKEKNFAFQLFLSYVIYNIRAFKSPYLTPLFEFCLNLVKKTKNDHKEKFVDIFLEKNSYFSQNEDCSGHCVIAAD